MSAPYAIINDQDAPVITVSFTGNQATDENFAKYLDQIEFLYTRQAQICLIFNAEKAVLPNRKYLQQQAIWLKEKEQLMRKYCRGTAYVIQTPMIRWALKAIFSLQTQPVAYTVVKTQHAAEEWARKQMN